MTHSHVIGFDDAPFDRSSSRQVRVIGAVCALTRLHGVLSFDVSKDGSDAAGRLIESVRSSRFAQHLQLVMLQGIAFAGFNVVDVFAVHEALGVPVLVVSRKEPDREAMRRILLERIEDGAKKWSILQNLGEMEPVRGIWVQRVGIEMGAVEEVLQSSVEEGNLPEPIRLAHLIAGGVVSGESRGRA